MRFKDRVAIVTGAAQGIGKGTARRFAEEGASVVVVDMNLKEAEKVASEIEAKGQRALAVRADVTAKTEVEQMVEKTLHKFGRVDILVNNAGIAIIKPITQMTLDEWEKVIGINLTGTFICCKAVAGEMIKQKKGSIINIASISGHRGSIGSFAYTASKAGVIGFTRALAVELADYGITVNSVSPGITETSMLEVVAKQGDDVLAARARRIPLNRIGKVADIVAMITYFASDEANYITGQDMTVDGGSLYLHSGFVRL